MQGVRRMKDGGFWTVFRDTGDPICYMIGKRFEQDRDVPSAGDEKARPVACAAGPRNTAP
jgi:hypothetical protein